MHACARLEPARKLPPAHREPEPQAAPSAHGTWMRRPWQMSHIFMVSGYVSRMYCSISRMARLCRVNSPSFCRDTRGAASPQATGTPGPSFPARQPVPSAAHRPRPRQMQRPGLRRRPERKPWTLPTYTLSRYLAVPSDVSHKSAQRPAYNEDRKQEGGQSPRGSGEGCHVTPSHPRKMQTGCLPALLPGASTGTSQAGQGQAPSRT